MEKELYIGNRTRCDGCGKWYVCKKGLVKVGDKLLCHQCREKDTIRCRFPLTELEVKAHLKAYRKAHYQRNRIKILEKQRKNYQRNRIKILEKQRKNYQRNRIKILEKQRKNYQRNRIKILEKQRKKVI
jgi:hypothetical protein